MRFGLRALLAAVALAVCADPVAAQAPPSADEITRSLRPKAKVRGLKVEPGSGEREAPPSIDLAIPFDLNSDKLRPDARPVLESLGRALRHPDLAHFRFLVAGHTDATGDDQYNLDLSRRRAETVRTLLILEFGIDPSRLRAEGFGSLRLRDPSNPASGVNRRVQIVNLGER